MAGVVSVPNLRPQAAPRKVPICLPMCLPMCLSLIADGRNGLGGLGTGTWHCAQSGTYPHGGSTAADAERILPSARPTARGCPYRPVPTVPTSPATCLSPRSRPRRLSRGRHSCCWGGTRNTGDGGTRYFPPFADACIGRLFPTSAIGLAMVGRVATKLGIT